MKIVGKIGENKTLLDISTATGNYNLTFSK